MTSVIFSNDDLIEILLFRKKKKNRCFFFFFFYCTTQRVQAAGARHHFLTYFRIWWDTWRLSRDVRAVPDGGAGPFLDAVNQPSLLCLLSSQTARLKGLMNAFVHRTGVRGISPLPENKKTLISKLCNVMLGRTGWLLDQIGKIYSVAEQKKKNTFGCITHFKCSIRGQSLCLIANW